MKIRNIIALSLTMASAQALAFQAKDNIDLGHSQQQLRAAEGSIISSFNHQYGVQTQTINLGTCAAIPVAGCGCPFCSMLRSQKI